MEHIPESGTRGGHHGNSCIGVGYWGVWRRDRGRVRLKAQLLILSQVTDHTRGKLGWDQSNSSLILECVREWEQASGFGCLKHGGLHGVSGMNWKKKNLQDGLFEGSLGGMLGSDARDERENRRVRSQCRILVHAVLTVDAPGFQFPCAVGAPVLPFLSGT